MHCRHTHVWRKRERVTGFSTFLVSDCLLQSCSTLLLYRLNMYGKKWSNQSERRPAMLYWLCILWRLLLISSSLPKKLRMHYSTLIFLPEEKLGLGWEMRKKCPHNKLRPTGFSTCVSLSCYSLSTSGKWSHRSIDRSINPCIIQTIPGLIAYLT